MAWLYLKAPYIHLFRALLLCWSDSPENICLAPCLLQYTDLADCIPQQMKEEEDWEDISLR